MATRRYWAVDIIIGERDGETLADARLTTHATSGLRAAGRAHLRPGEVDVPEVGDEIAVGRALHHLADRLLDVAAADIEYLTDESVDLRSR
ncbi:dsRBD fold-containing protein [Jiangella endophytica]|uniref:dsRBD fold-containing protein n=1 Tax=Jiangella endophytica TaxID=1623398 RepID=UPI000E340A58|nr:dsRBD fold-containing protein [Jiangella endophytica]